MMKIVNDFLIGYYWAPYEDEREIQNRLSNQTAVKITVVKENAGITPPTFFKTTEFTYVFQTIVDTYGVPNYKEANPMPVSIVSFPFFFGMMFGDMGHGSILAMVGIILVLMGHRLDRTMAAGVVPFRYFILMMGICATYCGALYNEWFAFPTQFFTSAYRLDDP
jgi:V-type H+-transporting ATPase subunit a